jgi:hypothetical protein
MGGTGIAAGDNSTVFYLNPASYSSIDTTSFVFDIGLDYTGATLVNGSEKYNSGDMNFHHLLIAFPVGKGIGIATGLVPFSNGYYFLSESVKEGDAGYDPVIGPYATVHRGSGSFSGFFLGTGMKIYKGLSAGANMTVLFGEAERLNQFEFADYSFSFSQRSSENLSISGISFDLGLQYSKIFSNKWFVSAGISAKTANNYRSSMLKLEERFTIYGAGPYSPDTLSYTSSTGRDSTRMPSSLRAGLAFGKKDKLTVEANYTQTNWSKAFIHGSSMPMADTKTLSAGIEFTPEKYSLTSPLKRIDYRIGGHTGNNYLIYNGAKIKEYGVSAGLGIRLRGSMTKTNIYFDYTKRVGDATAGLHTENVFSAGISLNIYDYWFLKRKYE